MGELNATYLEELKQFLRIPSISNNPQFRADVHRAAEFVFELLRKAGLENVALIEKEDRHPLVYADYIHAPGKPTLLLYGHYDVQPPDPLDEWTSPPFEPEIRGDNIYARGAADDKGQTLILIKAVETLLARDGRLPINIRFLIEGEEEHTGAHLDEFVSSHPDRVRADAVVICDTEMFAPNLPTICVGLRGIVYGELHVQAAEVDLHSGSYGGVAPNALQAACEIICALKDREGRVQIPGFYDMVRDPSPTEREAWNRLPFNEEEFRTKEVRSSALTGEMGFSVLDRVWARPTLEVHGIRGGYVGEGAKTVIPAKAVAKISARLVPNQDPDQIIAAIQKAVKIAAPRGVEAEYKAFAGSPATIVDAENPFVQAAAKAMTETYSVETVFTRAGGSIPIVGMFRKHLGIPSVLMGFGLPDDNLHAPNEKFYLPNFFSGIQAVIRYMETLG